MDVTRRGSLIGTLGVAIAAVVSSSGRAWSSPTSADDSIEARIKAISNVFEVGKPQPDYAYVENLNDGRGYTVTNYGFCTATGEVADLIRRYATVVPDTPLKRFLELIEHGSESVYKIQDFPAAWRCEVKISPTLGTVCEEEADRLFFIPAMQAARHAGVLSPVGKLVFYDTWLQHGDGDDPDSMKAICRRARENIGKLDSYSEPEFIQAFLSARRAVLLNPSDRRATEAWRESVPRIDALERLLRDNPSLALPVTVKNAEVSLVIE